jgi:hypothetical protein
MADPTFISAKTKTAIFKNVINIINTVDPTFPAKNKMSIFENLINIINAADLTFISDKNKKHQISII